MCKVLDSGWLTEGKVTAQFEEAVKQATGSWHAIAVTSATVGLELALHALSMGPGSLGIGQRVVLPAYTHPATLNAILLAGHVPVFVDVDYDTMLIDYDQIPESKMVMPVSLFGSPIDYDKIRGTPWIIEDAACSIGVQVRAHIAVFSFHPRKIVTTGEGGVICTNNDTIADWIRRFKNFGNFEMVGSNHRMSDINAALGLAQMEILPDLVERRRQQAKNYIAALAGRMFLPQIDKEHVYQTFCVYVEDRDRVMEKMREHGVEAQIGSYCLDESFPNAKWIAERCLALPLYHEMTETEQQYVIDRLLEAI